MAQKKGWEALIYLRVDGVPHIVGKLLTLQLCFRHCLNQRFEKKLWASKVTKILILKQNDIWM
jgi:hypothetical protein